MQSLPKSLFIFVFCVPLAIVLGVMLATPLDRTTLIVVLAGFLLLLTPILLTHHHAILIVSWNAYINAFFLPGQPYIWMVTTLISCFFLVLTRTLNRGKMELITVPSITWPLLAIALVSYVTSTMTGGVGAQAMGSDVFGGKRYFFLWGAVLGYFVLSSIPIPENRRQLLAGLFFLSSATAAFSNVAFMLGEHFYFLFLLFPVEWAMTQAASEFQMGGVGRVGGLGPAGLAVVSYILLRYGITGTFNLRKPWRTFAFFLALVAGMFSGYRGTLVLVLTLLVFQFFLEGLHKTKYLGIFLAGTVLCSALVLPVANRLPLSIQRCLTMLPLDLDQAVIDDARGSTDWRLEMWRAIIPDIPKYLLVGKGFTIDPKDLYFSQQSISRRMIAPYETSLIAGDYHNGPLTLIIPFGIWGVLTFGWFCVAAIRLLWRNYKYGEESLKNVNTFMFAIFLTKLTFFVFIFGAFYMDLATFCGIVGLSVSVNRGMASPNRAPVPIADEPEREIVPRLTWQPGFARGMQRS
jgi:hypothetical protein